MEMREEELPEYSPAEELEFTGKRRCRRSPSLEAYPTHKAGRLTKQTWLPSGDCQILIQVVLLKYQV